MSSNQFRCNCGESFGSKEELRDHLARNSDAADFRQHMPIEE